MEFFIYFLFFYFATQNKTNKKKKPTEEKNLYASLSVPFQEQHSRACGESLHKIVGFYHRAASLCDSRHYTPVLSATGGKVYTFVFSHNAQASPFHEAMLEARVLCWDKK